MKRRVLLLLFSLVCVCGMGFVLTGCGGDEEPPPMENAPDDSDYADAPGG